jgi:hypothetical protein
MPGDAIGRMGLARRLRDVVLAGRLAAAADQFGKAALLEEKARVLRDDLLGRAHGAATLDILRPHTAIPELLGILSEPIPEDIGDGAILTRRRYADMVAGYVIGEAQRPEDGVAGALRDDLDKLRRLAGVDVRPRDHEAARLEHFKQTGTAAAVVAEECRVDAKRAKDFLAAIKVVSDGLSDDRRRIRAEAQKTAFAEMDAALAAVEGSATFAEKVAIRDAALVRAKAFQEAKYSESMARTDIPGLTAEMKAAEARNTERAAKLIESIMESSPVTEAEAQAWASKQTITKNAANRLKTSGYPVDSARQDMAAFYRLTRGRLASITFDSDGGSRANANGIHGHGTSVVNIDSDFNKRVLWHEMAHHLEADPDVLVAAKGFLKKRGGEVKSLRSLTGSDDYRRHEKAYSDGFFHPYVGKIYSDATEVLSMGVESFHSPEALGARIAEDPEHFTLIAGILSSQPDPLFKSAKAVLAQAGELNAKMASAREAAFNAAIKTLADAAVLEGAGTTPDLGDQGWDVALYIRNGGGTYLGCYADGFYIFGSKKVKNPATGREGAGFILKHGNYSVAREKDLDHIKAMAVAWKFERDSGDGHAWAPWVTADKSRDSVIRIAAAFAKSRATQTKSAQAAQENA